MSFNIFVELDPATVRAIAGLEHWQVRFKSHVMAAMGLSAEEVQQQAEDYMNMVFINPQGGIEDTLQNKVTAWNRAQVWSEEPYAQRLQYGFSGMTDSLGRFYPYWPEYDWANHAIDMAEPWVEDYFFIEMEAAANGA